MSLGAKDRACPGLRRVGCGLAVGFAGCCLLWMLALQPAAALASADANWGAGVEAGLPGNASAAPGVILSSVSCASVGDCTAIGDYFDSSGFQGLLLTETAGAWATGVEADLPANANASPFAILSSVSCASAGNCAAVGTYNISQGLLLTESSGAWATGVQASLPANASIIGALSSVSCASAGNCTAVGDYIDKGGARRGVLLTESSGTWATGVEAGLPANASASPTVRLSSVSCASAGNCTAVGTYSDSAGATQGLLLTETAGAWGNGLEAGLPGNAAANPAVVLGSVSCASAGDCAAVGQYSDGSNANHTLLLDESSGTWATGIEAGLPANAGSSPDASLGSVSCASAGNCTAVGNYIDASNHRQGVLLTESSGAWATGVKASLPANAAADPSPFRISSSVSCVSAGNCTAVSSYSDSPGDFLGLRLTESSGLWGPGAETSLPANAAAKPSVELGSVSCASAGSCGAVGSYVDGSGNTQGLLLSAAPVSPTLSATAPASATAGDPIAAASVSATLAGGSAPIGTVTFTVFGPQPAPPMSCASSGTMLGSTSVSGNGTYHPSKGFTPATPGDYWWHASYGGDLSDNPATSACGVAMVKTVVAPRSTVVPPGPTSKPHPPALSAVRLGSKRFAAKKGTTLKLTLSQAARITVLITKTVRGHKVKGVCERHAKTGKRCTTTVTKRTLSFSGRAGANAFKLKLRRLAKGRYTAAVTAQNANGKSGTVRLKFKVTHG